MTASGRSSLRPVWRGAGYLCFGIGALGAVLPLLPTTGPWLLAVWCLWKGDDPLARRLLDHPKFGRGLRDWFEHGSISRKGKIAATTGMAAAVGIVALAGAASVLIAILAAVLGGVAVWLWSRPSAVPDEAAG